MQNISRGLELHATYVPEKEGLDKKRPKNNISTKRFHLIAVNKQKSVKPTKRRQIHAQFKALKLVTAKTFKIAVKQIVGVPIYTNIVSCFIYIYIYIYVKWAG